MESRPSDREGAPMSERKPGYFNNNNYYSFDVDEEGVWVYSECCADRLDREAASELYHLLGEWLIYEGRNRDNQD